MVIFSPRRAIQDFVDHACVIRARECNVVRITDREFGFVSVMCVRRSFDGCRCSSVLRFNGRPRLVVRGAISYVCRSMAITHYGLSLGSVRG